MSEHEKSPTDSKSAGKTKSLKPLRELLGFLWPHKMRLIYASAALIFTAMTQLSLGYGIQILIDQGFSNQSQEGLSRTILSLITSRSDISSNSLRILS